MVQKT